MNQRYNGNIKRPKPQDKQLGNLTFTHFAGKFILGPRYQENTPKNVVVQGRVQLEHSSRIVKVGVEATCQHFNLWRMLKETTEPAGTLGSMPQGSRLLGKGAKADRVIQLSCGKVRTHASYKITRTW